MDEIFSCSRRQLDLPQNSLSYLFSPKVCIRTCAILSCGWWALAIPTKSTFQGLIFSAIDADYAYLMMCPDKLMSSRQRGKDASGSNIGGNRQRIDCGMVATAINWNSKNGLNGGCFEGGGGGFINAGIAKLGSAKANFPLLCRGGKFTSHQNLGELGWQLCRRGGDKKQLPIQFLHVSELGAIQRVHVAFLRVEKRAPRVHLALRR